MAGTGRKWHRVGEIEQEQGRPLCVDVWTTNGVADYVEILDDCGDEIDIEPDNLGQLIALLQQAERMVKGEQS